MSKRTIFPPLTQEILKECLSYNPEDGSFTWIKSNSNRTKIGDDAGCFGKTNGYKEIAINNRLYPSHRLAWLYVHGYFPPRGLVIDHINGNTIDNRICNLRCVTERQNSQNRDIHRAGKLIGAHFDKKRGNWKARYKIRDKEHFIGRFPTEIEAHQAYLKAIANL